MKGNSPGQAVFDELKRFSKTLTAKFASRSAGQPEAQLKSPVEQLFVAYSASISRTIVLKDESSIERLGRPDYAVESDELLIGYIELKDPEKGANPEKFKGHDAAQWERFKNIPNILYTSANEWSLYQNGQLVEKIVRFDGDVCKDGEHAVTEQNAKALFSLLAIFTSWSPIVPVKPKELAAYLAPFCRLIREDVIDALKDPDSLMHSLKAEIQNLLFPDADNFRFADAYAQTVTFALLLAHLEQAEVLDLRNAYETLEKHHTLLSRSLEFLTDKSVRKEINTSLSLLQRVIHATPCEALTATKETTDPWLFFYEDFLEAYDPELRKKAGVYYTPLEVVQCQVRLIDELLQKQLGKEMGFVEAGVATLDPAVGTGTYLLAIIEHALSRVEKEEGVGAVKGGARSLINNLYGFEWMVGPYAVAQLRFSQALTRYKIALPDNGTGIYLTNTLESPHVKPPAPPLFHKPIAQEHERALKVKDSQHVLVCLGNPPYGRHESAAKDGSNKETTGGWVRYGEGSETPILESFLQPARDAGYGIDLKNIYNFYVYFIRWALWKVFEHKTAVGPGIVSFITASSYIDGDAYSGMREHMRRICDHIDVIDLGGEGRGTRKDENVFAIQTPVAIFIAWRKKLKSTDTPALVRYTKLEGTREEKLDLLGKTKSDQGLKWEKAPEGWLAPFRPMAKSTFSTWPKIDDLFPWQHSGVEVKRTWPIAPDVATLISRWEGFVSSKDKAGLLRETRDRKITGKYSNILNQSEELIPLIDAQNNNLIYPVRYAYRSFDRQWIIPDNRLGDYLRPQLWHVHGEKQLYFTSLFNHPLGFGQAITCCSEIPDRHHFRGSYGGKDVIPLFLDSKGLKSNILPGLIELIGNITAEDFAGYVYCLLSHREYTQRFVDELVNRQVRVPLTKDKKLFAEAVELGKYLIWLHTYGERLSNAKDRPKGKIPNGSAKCIVAVSESEDKYPNEYSYNDVNQTVTVGEGKFAPVSHNIWEFEVSGFKVVQSWLGYRMRERKGKKSSTLDDIHPQTWTYDFTKEFLELLWVLEKTIERFSDQKIIFDRILESDLFKVSELPTVPKALRSGPKLPKINSQQRNLWDEN
jgi:hypothetical protein